jgi:hypothetical protein
MIFGSSKKKTIDMAIMHMFEHHAINPEELTTCMKLKIKENICNLECIDVEMKSQ